MCTNITTTTSYTGCPATCNTSSTFLAKCAAATSSGVTCPNPTSSTTGKTTSLVQCPQHRDEGYSQR
ncbi:hypothetical protein LY76DRAFT_557645 [Colletotrichum caudatum]|nr:hypothetical protein LY76DRAFT_557645 [Colletotrichum caudatum]